MDTNRQTTNPVPSEAWSGERGDRKVHPIGEARGGEQRIAEWAATQARGLVNTAREGVEQATDYVQGAMAQTREAVNRYREGGFTGLRDDVVRYTREQPVTALLVAASVGLILGLLSSSARR
jgi:ElaB/YqjD/DUF883 family membrane-anchored ribosome-binding protein